MNYQLGFLFIFILFFQNGAVIDSAIPSSQHHSDSLDSNPPIVTQYINPGRMQEIIYIITKHDKSWDKYEGVYQGLGYDVCGLNTPFFGCVEFPTPKKGVLSSIHPFLGELSSHATTGTCSNSPQKVVNCSFLPQFSS